MQNGGSDETCRCIVISYLYEHALETYVSMQRVSKILMCAHRSRRNDASASYARCCRSVEYASGAVKEFRRSSRRNHGIRHSFGASHTMQRGASGLWRDTRAGRRGRRPRTPSRVSGEGGQIRGDDRSPLPVICLQRESRWYPACKWPLRWRNAPVDAAVMN